MLLRARLDYSAVASPATGARAPRIYYIAIENEREREDATAAAAATATPYPVRARAQFRARVGVAAVVVACSQRAPSIVERESCAAAADAGPLLYGGYGGGWRGGG